MTNKVYTFFICLFILFGLLFYNFIGYHFVDEILVAILVGYTLLVRLSAHKPFQQEFVFFLWIMFGYMLYSFLLRIASPIAIIYDLQQQMKPFLVFYCTVYLMPVFSKTQIKIIISTCAISFIIAVCAIPNTIATNAFMRGHLAGLASLSMTIFCIRYYFKRSKDIMSFSYLSIGLLSGKAKFFMTYVMSCLFLSMKKKIKLLNLKIIISVGLIICFLVYYVIWDKFEHYFIVGADKESGVARTLLYFTFWEILIDYFPFGSGFATFANHASRVFYSPLYYKYDLWKVWGLTPDNPAFVADTFYPELAQFGVVGITLFIVFLYRRYKEINSFCRIDAYILGMIILITILFESVADTTILSNRGVMLFVLLGFLHNEDNHFELKHKDG